MIQDAVPVEMAFNNPDCWMPRICRGTTAMKLADFVTSCVREL
jgi:hypothetical protein